MLAATSTTMSNVEENLPCEPLLRKTQTIQNFICSDLTMSLDAFWLSLIFSGLSMFVCLSLMGCISNRLAHRRTIGAGLMSVRPYSNDSDTTLNADEQSNYKLRKKFGRVIASYFSTLFHSNYSTDIYKRATRELCIRVMLTRFCLM